MFGIQIRTLSMFVIIIFMGSFVFAATQDISIYQGQYYEEGNFMVGNYNFSFRIYDDKEEGNLIYFSDNILSTGQFGEWYVELEGVYTVANNPFKSYFMEVSIDGKLQPPRRRITSLDFVRNYGNQTIIAVLNFTNISYFGDIKVANKDICLADGTNCPQETIIGIVMPSSPVVGAMYFDINSDTLKFYNGTIWREVRLLDQDLITLPPDGGGGGDGGDGGGSPITAMVIEGLVSEEVEVLNLEEQNERNISDEELRMEEPEEGLGCEISTELLEIRMGLCKYTLGVANELKVVVIYMNFGPAPTKINLTFEIFNSNGDIVYSKKENISVFVEEFRRYNFPDLVLNPGSYEFVFTTVYGANVTDEFVQAFIVEEKRFFSKILEFFRIKK